MTWFVLLGIAVAIATLAALTGLKLRGTRHVAHTSLMGVARIILVILAPVVAGFALRARFGG